MRKGIYFYCISTLPTSLIVYDIKKNHIEFILFLCKSIRTYFYDNGETLWDQGTLYVWVTLRCYAIVVIASQRGITRLYIR